MTRSSDISIIVQGDCRRNTEQVVQQLFATSPDAEVIVATFRGAYTAKQRSAVEPLVDKWVEISDPGSLPPTVRSDTAPENNLNRQIASTRAGLELATRPYILKLRSDAIVDVRKVAEAWRAGESTSPADPILVASRYTRHPDGINGYLFHLSDWITFGRADRVRAFWAAPLMQTIDATWFMRHSHPWAATATAKRFRALMSQEQWITTHYARGLGYSVPTHLSDTSGELRDAYRRFLVTHCVIADPDAIGLQVPKHVWAETSLFQRLDCISAADWRAMKDEVLHRRRRIEPLRFAARAVRHLIAAGILVRKRLTSPPASHKQPYKNERNTTWTR